MTRTWIAQRPSARLRLECLEDRTVPSTFTVNTTLDVVDAADGQLSLREAITKANTHAGADVVVLPAGVFKIALAGAGEDVNATGDFDITDALTIQGAGAGVSIVDGQQLDRVFEVLGSAPSSIKGVFQGITIRNGKVTGDGGGIAVGNADLVVRDCAVTANQAALTGGGISNVIALGTGNVTLVRTTLARNVAGTEGGGAAVGGAGTVLTVKQSTVRRNVATTGGGGINTREANVIQSTFIRNVAGQGGGGLFATKATVTQSTLSGNTSGFNGGGISAGVATLTGCTISGNYATSGGAGVRTNVGTLTNCTISGNSTPGDGGGVIAVFSVTLSRCLVNDNSATNAGGVDSLDAATLTNCTISGNSATGNGGGVVANSGTLLNCTVVENSAHTGGGLFHNPGGTFSVRNSIVALNLIDFGGSNPDVSGTFTSQGHNLIGDGTGGTGFGINFDIVGTAANPIDPKLGPLANNGGKTQTHKLQAGSPAIDAGDNAGATSTDQRGLPRQKDGNGDGIAQVDIGAFEK